MVHGRGRQCGRTVLYAYGRLRAGPAPGAAALYTLVDTIKEVSIIYITLSVSSPILLDIKLEAER